MFKIMLYIPSVMYHPLSIFTIFKVFIYYYYYFRNASPFGDKLFEIAFVILEHEKCYCNLVEINMIEIIYYHSYKIN